MSQHNQRGHGSAKQHIEHSHFDHLSHYAHQAHLAAEGAEFAADKLREASEFIGHCQAAAKMLKTHAQMARDLHRMHKYISSLDHLANRQRRNKEILRLLDKAKDAERFSKLEFMAEKPSADAAGNLLQELSRLKKGGASGKAIAKLGELANVLEGGLNGSRVGRALLTVGRVTASKTFVKGLIVVGAACEAASSYADSTAHTTGGRLANAALGAGAGYLIMKNPLVALADVLAPTGYKLSEIYHGGAGAITAIGEGAFTDDFRAMDDFHKRSMQGHYGKVIQAASEAGEYWANKGIEGGLKEFVIAVHWWVSL